MLENKIYLRDWYFNAGIIGFLTIAANGRRLENISSLSIGENFIEFDSDIFEGFEEKFIKHAFLKFFNTQAYLWRLQKVYEDMSDKKTKIKQQQIAKKLMRLKKLSKQIWNLKNRKLSDSVTSIL